MTTKSVVLCILDGWGIGPHLPTNGITSSHTVNWDRFTSSYPFCELEASDGYVGLPDGQMGNSEVGHMTIGSGRVVLQDLPRIDKALALDQVRTNSLFEDFIHKTKAGTGVCHLMGLLSPGGVHSHQDHIIQIAHLLSQEGLTVWVHCFLDGRDTSPQSGKEYLQDFMKKTKNTSIHIGTFGGRYHGMDRDKRWDRIFSAYQAIVHKQAEETSDPLKIIGHFYDQGLGDEFIPPHIIVGYPGIHPGDSLFVANFRADRARQILSALLLPEFDAFNRGSVCSFSAVIGLTEYSDELSPYISTLFPKQAIENTLSDVISNFGLTQLHTAETEKYAHVTFFFNGGNEAPLPGEDRHLIPSPPVATYDLQPEMSAPELTTYVTSAIAEKKYNFIVVNYANPDMVGHTGNQKAIRLAIETVDHCLGTLEKACLNNGYTLLITADHGNVEQMVDPLTNQPHTAHTCNPVPFVFISPDIVIQKISSGSLKDIAPTILYSMGLPIPDDMTGTPLITIRESH